MLKIQWFAATTMQQQIERNLRREAEVEKTIEKQRAKPRDIQNGKEVVFQTVHTQQALGGDYLAVQGILSGTKVAITILVKGGNSKEITQG